MKLRNIFRRRRRVVIDLPHPMMTQQKDRESLAVAIALLDQKTPHWRKLVNVALLDMTHIDFCVLGQIYGDYDVGMYKLFGNRPYDKWISARAFNASFPAALWIAEIRRYSLHKTPYYVQD